jgi:hypothetical protein
MVNFKINPLNVLGCRELEDPAPHFEYVYFNLKWHQVDPVREWILKNLKHRFYIGESLELENNQIVVKIKIGFEESKEASFFLLACSHLKDLNS